MPQLLLICAFVILAMTAPAIVTAYLAAAVLVITLITQKVTELVSNAPASTSDAFKSVCYAALFLAALAMFIYFLMHRSPLEAGIVFLVGFPVSYVAAFQVGMGLHTLHATVVALIVSAISWLLFFKCFPWMLSITMGTPA
jgi:hypothetical protein